MNIYSRIEHILGPRKITPWAKSLGLSSGMATKIQNNELPGTDILTLISRAENASITWLTTGRGAPFIVSNNDTPPELIDSLNAHLADSDNWQLTLLYSNNLDQGAAILLTQPMQYLYKKKTLQLQQLEILHGPWCAELINWLEKYPNQVCGLNVPAEVLQAIKAGRMGSYALLGGSKSEGLITRYKPDQGAWRTRPLVVSVSGDNAICDSPNEVQLMRQIIEGVEIASEKEGKKLSAEQRARVITSAWRNAIKKQQGGQPFDVQLIDSLIEVL
ncbi:hypothetical protein NO559_07840 [Dasania sp. GY-MA-18]|uniref:Uncharacterized protein n=1 Tax=Dasania phycosphaerae TaxID=2950436 RepID=A0A9J6RKT0_9GAMM|nr:MULTISPECIES: hypothetical protein [Dasania]MCR8922677.1 hypothetical protein [Dasania sp. GY-MA-18]MCZ0865107.1 hypothetical protein [Dasania phycosphaerae]MCZ0868833.1 hypothetical protein [Dasania phycosphaerae]